MKNREKLMKLMQEHPDLELKFMVSCNEYEDGFYTEVKEKDFRVTITELGAYGDEFIGDREEMLEHIQNAFADDQELVYFSDEAYEKFCQEWIESNIEFKEYIVIWL